MASTFEVIQTQTFSGSQASLTFSSIPATFTDLVLVVFGSSTAAPFLRINNDSTAQYSSTRLLGTGSTPQAGRRARGDGAPNDRRLEIGVGASADIPTNVFQINNYTNTNMLHMVLCRGDAFSSATSLQVGLHNSTTAITSLEVGNTNAANFVAGAMITLYGIKAA